MWKWRTTSTNYAAPRRRAAHWAPEFVTALESLLGRKIARRAPGRKTAIKAERPNS